MSHRLLRVSASSSTTSTRRSSSAGIRSLLGARLLVAAAALGMLGRQLLQGGQQTRHIKGFIAHRVRTFRDNTLDDGVHLDAMAGDDDGTRLGIGLPHALEHATAIATWQLHVDQHNAKIMLPEVAGS